MSGVCDVVSDTGTSSLWSLIVKSLAYNTCSRCSNSCFLLLLWQVRSGQTPGTWLLQSGSLDGGEGWSWCNGWCEFSFKALKYKLRCNFSQLSALKQKSLCPHTFRLWLEWWDADYLGNHGGLWGAAHLVLGQQRQHPYISLSLGLRLTVSKAWVSNVSTYSLAMIGNNGAP